MCLGDKIKEVENAAADYDHRFSAVEGKCENLQSENTTLQEKVVDLETRSRRQNIKIVGLPEKIKNR